LRPEVRAADWKAIAEFDVRDRLSELRMPTSVLYGTRDPLVPLSGVRGFIGTSGVVNAESLEQAGHWLMLEQPGVVAAWLRRFLSLVNALAHRSSDDFREFKAPLQPKNWEANKPES
jgi:pimeloyl-ACP methyl ester carboxylesterase